MMRDYMENNTEKSAIDIIYEMHSIIDKMSKKIDLLEKQMALMQSSINGELLKSISNNANFTNKSQESFQVKQSEPIQAAPKLIEKSPNTRVAGKFFDMRNKPIDAIEVTVLDIEGKIVKVTKTNKGGEWMCFLPPGEYSAEFIKQNMAPQFKNFQVLPGQTNIEVF